MKTVRIKAKEGLEIDSKRFYFPGIYTIECPNCKAKMVDNLSETYLSYPAVGDNITRYIRCDNCDAEYELPATIKSMSIVLEIDEASIRKIKNLSYI